MSQDKERFLKRWSRLKRESEQVPEEEAQTQAPVLPPVEGLTPESDFTGFMHPKVEDALRRVALKKLFSDPHFNVPDPYEAYSGDWTVGEPIAEEMLAQLNQARTLLLSEEEKKAQDAQEPRQEPQQQPQPREAVAEKAQDDEPGRQDT